MNNSGQSPSNKEILADKIGSTVKEFIRNGELAGAVTITAHRGSIVQFDAQGLRDLSNNLPMERDTIFRIYSMTKPVGSVALLMLYERGLIDLEVPASEYLSDLEGLKVVVNPEQDTLNLVDQIQPLTVIDLMRHTAGMPGAAQYLNGSRKLDQVYREAGLTNSMAKFNLEEIVKNIGKIPLMYQPGTKWHYSLGADILGRLVEVVSGKFFDEFLFEHIFVPLGMDDTDFFVPPEKLVRFAAMHGPNETGGLKVIDAPQGGTNAKGNFSKRPAFLSNGGGLVSTASDFMRFCLMLSNGGTLEGVKILNKESVQLLMRNHLPEHLVPIDKLPQERYAGLGFGLGVSVRVMPSKWSPESRIGESGWIGGASTEFWISPEDELISISLAQNIPFVNLAPAIKPIVYNILH